MSLLFFDGFQDVTTVPKPEWVGTVPSSVTGRDGSLNGAASSATSFGSRYAVLPTPAATCIAGVAFKPGVIGTPYSYAHAIGFRLAGSSDAADCLVVPNSIGMLELRRQNASGTLLATASGHAPLQVGVWYFIEAKAVLHATAGSVEVRLNGVTVINYSGPTASSSGSVAHVTLGPPQSSGYTWDDMWVCDGVDATATQGAANNDFLGDLKVVSMFPNGAGDSTQWSPSAGANYAAVDESPPNTSDYVSTSVSGTRDLYSLDDLPTGASNPKAIRIGVYAQKTDAGPSSIKPVIKENGVITPGSPIPMSQSWASYFGALQAVKPSGGAWTASDLNALQAGVELA